MMNPLHKLSELNAKQKRMVAVVVALAVIVGVAALFQEGEKTMKRPDRQETVRHIFTDSDTRNVGIDAVSAQLELMKRQNSELATELTRFKEKVEKSQASTDEAVDMSRDLNRLKDEVKLMKDDNRELTRKLRSSQQKIDQHEKKLAEGTVTKRPDETSRNTPQWTDGSDKDLAFDDPADYFSNAKTPAGVSEDGDARDKGGKQDSGMIISTISTDQGDSDKSLAAHEEPEDIFLPAGSILTGALINGTDAPTGQQARQDPFPITLRIQKEAILPNRFRADIRECFLIMGGYGDLSSERFYGRGETLSCVKENGDVIETRLASYAVGEDGKAGIRGRLVSKQGQIIAKSLMAGFLSGAAEAFDVDAVPTLNLDSTGQTEFQSTDFSKQLAQGAAAKGASSALDRIAQFYIQMAEGIFPVIEVDAGRQIDMIVTQGTKLTVRGKNSSQANEVDDA